MTTLNDLIIREITLQIHREPTLAEVFDAARWLHEHINEKSTFVDYEYEIMMWKKQLEKDE